MAVPKKIESEIMEVLDKFTEYMTNDYGHGKETTLQYMKTVIESLLPEKEHVPEIKECKKVEFVSGCDAAPHTEEVVHVSGCDAATNTEEVVHVSRRMSDNATNTEQFVQEPVDVFPDVVVPHNVSTGAKEFVRVVSEKSIPQTPYINPKRVQNTSISSNTHISPCQSKNYATKTEGEYTVHEMSDFEEYLANNYSKLVFAYDKAHLDSHVQHSPSQPRKKAEGFYIKTQYDSIFVNMSCMYGLVPFIYNYSRSGNIAGDVYLSLAILKKNMDIFRIMFPTVKIDTLIGNMSRNPSQKFFLKPDVLNKMTLLLQFAYDKVPTLPMFEQNYNSN